ncbi:hypothetical protein Tco_0496688 [Tanacetum coccineum]
MENQEVRKDIAQAAVYSSYRILCDRRRTAYIRVMDSWVGLKTRVWLDSMSFEDPFLNILVVIVNLMECVLHSFVAENDQDQDMIYEDFDQVDQLEMEEMDLKWQMAMLSLRINRCYKCLQWAIFLGSVYVMYNLDDKTRYSAFKVTEVKSDEPKALVLFVFMDGLVLNDVNWLVADALIAAAEFAMMGFSPKDKSSGLETHASLEDLSKVDIRRRGIGRERSVTVQRRIKEAKGEEGDEKVVGRRKRRRRKKAGKGKKVRGTRKRLGEDGASRKGIEDRVQKVKEDGRRRRQVEGRKGKEEGGEDREEGRRAVKEEVEEEGTEAERNGQGERQFQGRYRSVSRKEVGDKNGSYGAEGRKYRIKNRKRSGAEKARVISKSRRKERVRGRGGENDRGGGGTHGFRERPFRPGSTGGGAGGDGHGGLQLLRPQQVTLGQVKSELAWSSQVLLMKQGKKLVDFCANQKRRGALSNLEGGVVRISGKRQPSVAHFQCLT